MKKVFLFLLACIIFTGCGENQSIVNQIDEREANEIIVFLASKGIKASKKKVEAEGAAAAGGTQQNLWNIYVEEDKAIAALSILNYNGLPRRKGTTLLELFAKTGLMTSDKEENIRYQSGIEEELKNTIRKIDGIIDADVQISFPTAEALEMEPKKIKAAVYVKHQGVFDDPNNHLESKIKRLLSGSIDGLEYESVSVISDKSRFTDIKINGEKQLISPGQDQEYVKLWSMTMTKASAKKFRMIFFLLLGFVLVFGAGIGYLIYRWYPDIIKKIKKTE